ncbi:Cysteine/O-acetylserine efflux protein [BD1-7 clade bacterium]|uniref:Cysteine/O-acetylserine efflux protein n=1 Tax=BD1-7 clade bacterium TaxID=2029982 RepID=A0A5S9Q3R7_9GAMM|nr:Cysteine/O-acetylserine efflux protein [BD1-7 clade bacterium]
MLMASGANYGWRKSLPHISGVIIGFCLMVMLVGLGVEQLFVQYPQLNTLLRVFSISFLLYLAWRVLRSHNSGNQETATGQPITFFQAMAFQWVNPKAWTIALTALGMAATPADQHGILMVVLVIGVFNAVSANAWVCFGQQIVRLLSTDRNRRVFNYCVAGGLVASIVPILLEA